MNMRSYGGLSRLITLTLLLGLVCSCVPTTGVKPTGGSSLLPRKSRICWTAPFMAAMFWPRFTGEIRWNSWMPGNQPGGRLNSSAVGRGDGFVRNC